MNNKALEALAALAAVAPATSETIGDRSSGNQQLRPTNSHVAAGTTTSMEGTHMASHSLPAALQQALANGGGATSNSTGSQQHWQQAGSSGLPAGATNNSNLALLAGMQQLQQADRSGLLSLQQQLAYYQYLMGNPSAAAAATVTSQANRADAAAAMAGGAASGGGSGGGGGGGQLDAQTAVALALAGQQSTLSQQLEAAKASQWQQNLQQLLPSTTTNNEAGNNTTLAQTGSPAQGSMPPPSSSSTATNAATSTKIVPAPGTSAAAQAISVTTQGVPSPTTQRTSIAPMPLKTTTTTTTTTHPDEQDASQVDGGAYSESQLEDKKLQKRAANRRSAQLSRKRKKQFIEELKDENDALRRKEQILMSIPDLIVVFDSTGRLWFVSQSVRRFLDFSADELEGTSFWERLCQDSVRLLKAAFMDSLAARVADSDTAPLGEGYWELRLVDKDGSQKIVTVNGVVHFAGDRPECVCTIRPRDQQLPREQLRGKARTKTNNSATISVSAESTSQAASAPWIQVDPRQSVVADRTCSSDASSRGRVKGRQAVRISDTNSSGDSESSDEMEASATQQAHATINSGTGR